MDRYIIIVFTLVFLPYCSPFLIGRSSTYSQTLETTSQTTANVCQFPSIQRKSVPGGCNFNNGTCGYDFPTELWRLHTEPNGAVIFGKNDDDDYGIQQTFALFMTNDSNITISTARSIVTNTLPQQNVCLKFWYLIPNKNSELKVYIIPENRTSFLIGETYHQLSQQWKKVEVPILMDTPFKVSFTSSKENDFGYVGLDSISFDVENPLPPTDTTTSDHTTTSCYCYCPPVTGVSECLTTSLTKQSTTTGLPIPQAKCQIDEAKTVKLPGSCNFDKDVCGYSIPLYPHLWEITSNRYTYGSPSVGEILGDHSVDGFGGYLIFDTNNKHVQKGVSGEATSPPMFGNSTSCLEFWYNMPNNLALLEVYILNNSAGHQLLWNQSGPSNGWQIANVQFHVSGVFQILFKSTKTSEEAFIGLDDVLIVTGTVDTTSSLTTERPLSTESGTMVTADICNCACPSLPPCSTNVNHTLTNNVCNGKYILHNASCDFDEGQCSFMIPMYPHLWDIVRYDYGDKTVGMIEGDHTTGGQNGMYAVFNTFNWHVHLGAYGEIASELIVINTTICLTFWYNMPTDNGSLSVHKRYEDRSFLDELLWKQSHSKTKGWVQSSVVIPSSEPFQIVFSSVKADLSSYLAIDDIFVRYDIS